MASRKTRSYVLSYFDLLDPNKITVIPNGFSKLQIATCAVDWGTTASQIGARLDANAPDRLADGTPIPLADNTRWMTPYATVVSSGGTATFPLNGTMPGEYFTSFNTTYATRVPPFVSLIVEGVDAPDNRVAVLTPGLQFVDNGANGTVFNIVDKNMKVRLVDPWGKTIINMAFSATITLLE